MMRNSIQRLAGAAVMLLMLAGHAHAQAWPTRAITLIVPFTPGGTTDIVSRAIAQKLSEQLGQPVVVDNRGGAGGNLGANIAAKAAPDGYTVFMATVAHAMAPGLYKQLPYDFQRDFDPVTVVASLPNVLIVNPAIKANTVAEFIAYLKANPEKVNYGSAGPGSTEHMSGELFRSLAGVKITHVPYKGGAPMMLDLMSGQIQMAIETSASAQAQVKAGKVKALAVTTAKRSPAFPGIPTLKESGLPAYEVTTWYGMLVPHGTPAPAIARLYRETEKALKAPDILKRFEEFGAAPGGEPPEQFARFIKQEIATWTRVAKESGASIE
jgi:tripartite-type tricarboxylate transporter receptor subunit TctC